MTAFIVIASIAAYLVLGFATGGYIYYCQTVYPERWHADFGGYMSEDDRQTIIALGACFWPIAWLVFIPACAAMRLADRIAVRGVERRKIAEAEQRDVDRALRELDGR